MKVSLPGRSGFWVSRRWGSEGKTWGLPREGCWELGQERLILKEFCCRIGYETGLGGIDSGGNILRGKDLP